MQVLSFQPSRKVIGLACSINGHGGYHTAEDVHEAAKLDFSNTLLKEALANRKATDFLYGADLSGVDFEREDLSQLNLQDTDLTRANLNRANLYRARLERAILDNVSAIEALFIRANLTKASLIGAKLDGANLMEANLTDSTLSTGNLFERIHSEDSFIQPETAPPTTSLLQSILGRDCDSDLSPQKVKKRIQEYLTGLGDRFLNLFIEVERSVNGLDGERLTSDNLQELVGGFIDELTDAVFKPQERIISTTDTLFEIEIDPSNPSAGQGIMEQIAGMLLGGGFLPQAISSRQPHRETSLIGANLSGANLTSAILHGVNLRGAILKTANLNKADFSRSNLSFANLTGTQIDRTDFSNSNLVRTNFRNASGRLTNFRQAVFSYIEPLTNVENTNRPIKDHSPNDYFQGKTTTIDPPELIISHKDAKTNEISNIQSSSLNGAVLFTPDFSGADLANVDLTYTFMEKPNFREARLSLANITGAKWENPCLYFAEAQRLQAWMQTEHGNESPSYRTTLFTEPDLRGTNLCEAYLPGLTIKEEGSTQTQIIAQTNLRQAHFGFGEGQMLPHTQSQFMRRMLEQECQDHTPNGLQVLLARLLEAYNLGYFSEFSSSQFMAKQSPTGKDLPMDFVPRLIKIATDLKEALKRKQSNSLHDMQLDYHNASMQHTIELIETNFASQEPVQEAVRRALNAGWLARPDQDLDQAIEASLRGWEEGINSN